MSDAATDARYEQNLKRCRVNEGHSLFYFNVGEAQVGVCSLCHIRFIEDVTAGDGSEWDQEAREALEASIDAHPAGKSASGTVTCCEPRFLHTPSGAVFAHSRFCKEFPEQKIDLKDYAKGREWHVRRPR